MQEAVASGAAVSVGGMISAAPTRVGEALGVLSLATRFPRIPGDVGNPATWPFPVLIRTVADATPGRVVHGRADGLVEAFAEAGRALAADGALGVVTTCGFLVLHQAALQARLPVPIASSALLQLPLIARCLPAGRMPGVLTASAASLSCQHLAAAGAHPDTPVAGVPPNSHFADVFLGDAASLDPARAEADVVATALALVRREPRLGALVLECANMPPYAQAVRRATGLPVYDAVSFGTWFMAGLAPRVFPRQDTTR
jgi:hypothetical protein